MAEARARAKARLQQEQTTSKETCRTQIRARAVGVERGRAENGWQK